MEKQVIFKAYNGERWIYGNYLCSAYYATGSNIWIEPLNPILSRRGFSFSGGNGESGWYYMMETEDECVNRLISKFEHPTTHACWRESVPAATGYFSSYGKARYIDTLTKELVTEIEARPEFMCWEYISYECEARKYITKKIYDPIQYTYTTGSSI